MRNWRKFTWVILIIQVLFVIWIVAAVGSAADDCKGLIGDELSICETGTAVGTSIGVGLVIFLWAAVDVILGIIWLVTNRSQRDCPICGRSVKKGLTKCGKCGYDFASKAV